MVYARPVTKITVMPVTVTLSGNPPVEARRATNVTTVQPVSVTLTGTAQTVDVGPSG